MKKAIFTLIAILIIIYAVLSLLGSGGEYTAEKLFYRAMKMNSKIVINPEVAPPKLLSSVEKDLQKLLKKYPKSNMAKTAHIALAEFYVSNKKYDEALSALNIIINTYSQEISIASTAQFLKGIVYEKQGQWDKALKEYTILQNRYADTRLGMQVPLYIGKYYTKKGIMDEATKAYNEAVVFYEKIEGDNRGRPRGYVASGLLVQALLNLKNYDRAGKVVEDTINNYPSSLTLAQFLPYVEMIFVKLLNKPEKAIEIYKNVKGKTRDEKLIKFLQKKIEALEAKK